MEIRVGKEKLINILNIIMKGIDFVPILNSLKGVFIKIAKTELTFISSNGNLSIKKTLKTDEENVVIKTGEILVPCKLLLEVIKKQIGNIISIKEINNILYITSKNSSITINLLEKETFPHINFDLNGKEFKIKKQIFYSLYQDVNFAAAEDDKKLILNGLNLAIKNGILTATATNSYRLATKKVIINSQKEINITIYSKNIKKFIFDDNNNNELNFVIDDQKINLINKNTIIQSKLLEGDYPETKDFIPKEFLYELQIDSFEIQNLIQQATVINNSQSSSIKMEVTPDKKLIIKSKKEEIGSIEVNKNDIQWRGEPMIINYDSKFMLEALKIFKGKIKILLNGELKPIIIKSDSKPELTQLVLPQKTY